MLLQEYFRHILTKLFSYIGSAISAFLVGFYQKFILSVVFNLTLLIVIFLWRLRIEWGASDKIGTY